MDEFTIKSIVDYPQEDLLQEMGAHQAFIDRIKGEIAQEWDNINNPVAFTPSNEVPVYEMT